MSIPTETDEYARRPQTNPSRQLATDVMAVLDLDLDALFKRLGLSVRERDLVEGAFQAETVVEAAKRMSISPHTVRTYWQRIYRKTTSSSRGQVLLRLLLVYIDMQSERQPDQS